MSAIVRLPGLTFSNAALPKLYRDKAITPGTKWMYDGLDPYCWPSQAAPNAGAMINSLTDAVAAATVGSTPPGFSAGGFTFTNASINEKITLPSKPQPTDTRFMVGVWFEHGTQTVTTGASPIIHCMDSNSVKIFGVTCTHNAGNGAVVYHVNNTSIGPSANVAAGTRKQAVIVAKKQGDGTFSYWLYLNGVQVATATSAATSIASVALALPMIGGNAAANFDSGTWIGTVHRAYYDDLTSDPDVAALVAADWNENKTRLGYA